MFTLSPIFSRHAHTLSLGRIASERWSGYHGEWGGLGGDDRGYVNDTEFEPFASQGERREAGFSSFHIRRGDFQYEKVSGVLFSQSLMT